METGEAEIELIWKPINTTIRRRYNKLLNILEEDYKQDKWEFIGNQDLLREHIRKLPAHVIDSIREQFPLTAAQLKLLEENRVEKKLFQFDYDTV